MFLEEDKEESPGHALQVVHPEYQPVPHKLGDTNNNWLICGDAVVNIQQVNRAN